MEQKKKRSRRMTIRHKKTHYIAHVIWGVIFLVSAMRFLAAKQTSFALLSFIVIMLIVISATLSYNFEYLQYKNGIITGHKGIIRKQELSTSINNIDGCGCKKFLWANRITITSGLTVISWADMGKADKFVSMILREQSK